MSKIGYDQIINLIWVCCIIVLAVILLSAGHPNERVDMTASGVCELIEKGQLQRDGITVSWGTRGGGDAEELRRAAKLLESLADKVEVAKNRQREMPR